jgi:hypothetical protein
LLFDLLVARGGRGIGFEFKRTVAPGLAKSMRIARALQDVPTL